MRFVHTPSSLDKAPPAGASVLVEGAPTPSRAGRVQAPAPFDVFEVDFDPRRNYLRELKHEREKER